MSAKTRGQLCESLVAEYITNEGYSVLARNFRGSSGEVDIIAEKNSTICFVEVKSFPKNWPVDDIALKVPASKMQKIKKTAIEFLDNDGHIKYSNLRFDVASVCGDEVTYYEGAF